MFVFFSLLSLQTALFTSIIGMNVGFSNILKPGNLKLKLFAWLSPGINTLMAFQKILMELMYQFCVNEHELSFVPAPRMDE